MARLFHVHGGHCRKYMLQTAETSRLCYRGVVLQHAPELYRVCCLQVL
eukprot:COSAG06_NODE_12513_length_1371_cov_1.260220_3_plen_47_part_01